MTPAEKIDRIRKFVRLVESADGALEQMTATLKKLNEVATGSYQYGHAVDLGVDPRMAERQATHAAEARSSSATHLDKLVESMDAMKYHLNILVYEMESTRHVKR